MHRPHSNPTTLQSHLSSKARTAFAFAIGLLLYGNAVSLSPSGLREDFDWLYVLVNAVLTVLLIYWAVRIDGLTFGEIGITREHAIRSALIGAGLALAVSLPVVLYFAFPVVVDEPVQYDAVDDLTLAGFLVWALVKQPLGTAVFEEVAFRGILQAKMTSLFTIRAGIAITSVVFALWHVVINYRTIEQTNVGDSAPLAVLAQVGSLVGLFVGGVFMSLLRHYTHNLAGPIVFHWLVVIVMTGELALLNR
jgi:membrane protease YdiL (CAAX protease family)